MSGESLPLLPVADAGLSSPWLRMLAQEGLPTVPHRTDNASAKFVLYDARRKPTPRLASSEQTLVDVSLFEFDSAAVDVSASTAPRTARTIWRVGAREVAETTAAVDHRAVRRLLMARLRQAIEEQGGVWIVTSPYPWPYRTAAHFRFDHDRYVAEDFDGVLEAIRGHEEMTTHFVCAATHAAHHEALAALRGLDVGSHGYHHHTYRTAAENFVGISRCIDFLRGCGIEPNGFAAPLGRYNPGLAEALSSLGINYSSEFAAAYDDLPFAPSGANTLQIPIHPVCLGAAFDSVEARSFVAQEGVAAAVGDYFAAAVIDRRAAGEPIFFYGHPDGRVGRHPQVLRRFFDAIDQHADIWRTTLGKFARWWRARNRVRWSVHGTALAPVLRVEAVPGEFHCALQWMRGNACATAALTPGSHPLAVQSLRFEVYGDSALARPVRREPLRGIRRRLHEVLDWEYETPVAEIDAGHWRGWAKRSLRRVKGGAS